MMRIIIQQQQQMEECCMGPGCWVDRGGLGAPLPLCAGCFTATGCLKEDNGLWQHAAELLKQDYLITSLTT